jgi:hypothetical protein
MAPKQYFLRPARGGFFERYELRLREFSAVAFHILAGLFIEWNMRTEILGVVQALPGKKIALMELP